MFREVLKALTVFNWIGPALSVADQAATGATRMYYPMYGKYSNGHDIVKELHKHGIGVRLLTRMVINDCYVFSVDRQDVERARRILEGK